MKRYMAASIYGVLALTAFPFSASVKTEHTVVADGGGSVGSSPSMKDGGNIGSGPMVVAGHDRGGAPKVVAAAEEGTHGAPANAQDKGGDHPEHRPYEGNAITSSPREHKLLDDQEKETKKSKKEDKDEEKD